jgi:nitroimidazol reductase NimA-like FMN-containing flavoprotein (pyridoxamine 5'-phosphate oxidase superfamily)
MRNHPIEKKADMLEIMHRCQWCHMAMVDAENKPYLLPMNFGFASDVIYIHGSQRGKKAEILAQNPDVCINFSIDHVLRYQHEEVACSWSMKYRSVLVYGKAESIEDPLEKAAALNVIMKQYTDRQFNYSPPSLREVRVWKISIDRIDGRIYGY